MKVEKQRKIRENELKKKKAKLYLLVCKTCGKEFMGAKNRVYCKDECRNKLKMDNHLNTWLNKKEKKGDKTNFGRFW